MRRLFLAAVLALTNAQTWAQKELTGGFWKCTGHNGNIGYTNIPGESAGCQSVAIHWFAFSNQEKKTQYLSDDSLVRAGSYWEIWGMWIVSVTRHDCLARTAALMQTIFYSEELGKGEPVYSWGVSAEKAVFEAATPDTGDEKLMDYVCRIAGTTKTEQQVN